MYIKDEFSYKSKEGWEEYKNKSYMLLPKIFQSHLVNFVFYAGIAIGVGFIYHQSNSQIVQNKFL